MYSSFVLGIISNFSLSFFSSTNFLKNMTIVIRKFMKNKWDKISLFLCYINITIAISNSSVFTCQVTMISNFIRISIFFTKSTNNIISITFCIFLCQNNIFISVFEKENRFIFRIYSLIHKPIYIIIT